MTDPLVLGFDTSGPYCTAALIRGSDCLDHVHEDLNRGQAERLMPLLGEMLARNGFDWSDLDVLGVGIGPGNFTGIRISVAACHGLAMGLGIPAVGVSALEALAFGNENVIASTNAPQGRFYVQAFVQDADGTPTLCDADLSNFPAIPDKADPGVIGPAAAVMQPGKPEVKPRYRGAEAIARLAMSRVSAGHNEIPRPLYIKPPDAAPARDDGLVLLDDA